MTKTQHKNLFTKFIAVLVVIFMLSTTACFITACNEEAETEEPTTTYSYTDTNNGKISNADFSYGMADATSKSFLKSSVTGWTLARDNNARTSNIDSGVIGVDQTNWKVVEEVFDDKDYLAKPENPGVHEDAKDYNVYMLNNYSTEDYAGLGTAQRIKSSSTVTITKGKYAKISVWVKTANLKSNNTEDYGANIRIVGTFNNATQAEYRINNIRVTDWTQYTVYVKADQTFACKVNVMLGLGYGNGNSTAGKYFTEGTVYFDDLTYEEVDAAPVSATEFVFGSKENIEVNAGTETQFAYSMDIANQLTSYQSVAISGKGFTKANNSNDTSETLFGSTATLSKENDYNKVEVKNASYFVTFNFNDVENEGYTFITFLFQNKLSKLGSTSIDFTVVDKNGNDAQNIKTSAYSVTEVNEEDAFVGLLIKNNFPNDVDSTTRTFDLIVTIGPKDTEISTKPNACDYASGIVLITDVKAYSGSQEDELYKDLFSTAAQATTNLYAGYSADYQKAVDEKTSYSLTPASTAELTSEIKKGPASLANYIGVSSNSIYVKADGTENVVDSRTITANQGNGSYAGLVNTKYVNEYQANADFDINIEEFKAAIAYNALKESQSMMIYNKDNDCYGYFGTKQSVGISSTAKVSVTLRVYGENAKAFIYLVNASTDEKDVMTFADFTVNSDGIKDIEGQKINGADYPLMLEIDSSMIEGNGWLTVNFYLATGSIAKDFRVEIWNGSRDGATKSQGYVFVNDIQVTTSSAFTTPTKWVETFSVSGNPLFDATKNAFDPSDMLIYKQQLTDLEKQFNSEQEDKSLIVSYEANYVWAKNDTMIYADYSSIEPVEVNPYTDTEETEEEGGCASKVDPSTFWFSFSSILLAVVLILALIVLLAKRFIKKTPKDKKAKAHYQVKSRIHYNKNEVKEEKVDEVKEEEKEEIQETSEEEPSTEQVEEEQQEVQEENKEETLDSYVYGDVQDFGETQTNEQKPEEEQTSEEEKPSEEGKTE